ALRIWPICFSSSGCQGCPGGSSHSSSQGRTPRPRSARAIAFTAGLSALLWQRKTSKRPSARLVSSRRSAIASRDGGGGGAAVAGGVDAMAGGGEADAGDRAGAVAAAGVAAEAEPAAAGS